MYHKKDRFLKHYTTLHRFLQLGGISVIFINFLQNWLIGWIQAKHLEGGGKKKKWIWNVLFKDQITW